MRHISELPGACDWDQWLLLVGACLGGQNGRDMVFSRLAPEDCRYDILVPVLTALKENDIEGAKQGLEQVYFLYGTDFSKGVLAGLVEKVFEIEAKRKRILEAEELLRKARSE